MNVLQVKCSTKRGFNGCYVFTFLCGLHKTKFLVQERYFSLPCHFLKPHTCSHPRAQRLIEGRKDVREGRTSVPSPSCGRDLAGGRLHLHVGPIRTSESGVVHTLMTHPTLARFQGFTQLRKRGFTHRQSYMRHAKSQIHPPCHSAEADLEGRSLSIKHVVLSHCAYPTISCRYGFMRTARRYFDLSKALVPDI